jgi:hypothetical protein
MAGMPEGRNAGMPEVQRVFEPPSLPASPPQAYYANSFRLDLTILAYYTNKSIPGKQSKMRKETYRVKRFKTNRIF